MTAISPAYAIYHARRLHSSWLAPEQAGIFSVMDRETANTEPAASAQHNTVKRELEQVYTVTAFIGRFFREALRPPYEWREVIRQCRIMGL
jgi:hypothetical protein